MAGFFGACAICGRKNKQKCIWVCEYAFSKKDQKQPSKLVDKLLYYHCQNVLMC